MKRIWKQEFKIIQNYKAKLDETIVDCMLENFSSIY